MITNPISIVRIGGNVQKAWSTEDALKWKCLGRDPRPGEACIYLLRTSRSRVPRYIGVTTAPLHKRLAWHVGGVGTGYESGRWISEQGRHVRIEAIVYVPVDQRFDLERVAIRAGRESGLPLTNGGK